VYNSLSALDVETNASAAAGGELDGRGEASARGSARSFDSDLNAFSSFDNPDRVTIKPHPVTVDAGRIAIALPAMSIATVTVETV
jgi:hypothetical protein